MGSEKMVRSKGVEGELGLELMEHRIDVVNGAPEGGEAIVDEGDGGGMPTKGGGTTTDQATTTSSDGGGTLGQGITTVGEVSSYPHPTLMF